MLTRIKEYWIETSSAKKIGFVLSAILIIAIFVGLLYWVMRDDYQVLFTDLDAKDAASIVSELDKLKVPYRLENEGTSIYVEKDLVHKTRLKLMGKGVILHGTVGFEIFNNTDFGMTEFAQKINYQRALQGELARTIMSIDEVKQARVHLVMNESGLFKKNAAKSKASVTLYLKGESRLRPEQVLGIQRLVAASVPDIDPALVTVLDQHGVALTRSAGIESEIEISGDHLEAKKQIENYITVKVVKILDKALGPGQAIVSVDVSLDHDHVKTTREEVLSLSSKNGESLGAVTRKRVTIQGNGHVDVATIESSQKDNGKSTSTASSSVETEYQNGRQVEQTVSTPGSIRRLSIGVLLPRNVDSGQVERLREVISMAAGLNLDRGDAIAMHTADPVIQIPSIKELDKPDVDVKVVKQTKNQFPLFGNLSLLVFMGVILIIAIVLLVYRNKRHKKTLTPYEREEALVQIRQWLNTERPAESNL